MSNEKEWDEPTEYEKWYDSSLGKAYGKSLNHVLRKWLPDHPEGRIVDIGCGPGLLLEQLLPDAPNAVAVDCSPEMSHRAKYRFDQAALPYRVITASADTLPFPDQFAEMIITTNCLEFVDHPGHAFKEISRVLQTGGTVILGVLNRNSIWETTRKLIRPLSSAAYYDGQFYTCDDILNYAEQSNLTVDSIETAVHFPPMSPGPFTGLYDMLDQMEPPLFTGGVLLCKAHR